MFSTNAFVLSQPYVDDILIATKELSKLTNLKDKLSQEFEIKDFGVAKKTLGMQIESN